MTVTARRLQMTIKAGEAQRQTHGDLVPTREERAQLQVLIADLLSENQKLRFRLAQLEHQAHRAERMALPGGLRTTNDPSHARNKAESDSRS
jgi:hypothetical protein